MTPSLTELAAEIRRVLPQCLPADQARLANHLRSLDRHPPRHHDSVSLVQRWLAQALASQERRQRRQALRTQLTFPPGLPILDRRDEIIRTIQSHPVVIVAGETGSGKTTQLPKFCLAAGLGVLGRIGCTQPRRVAALSISRRVAEELGVTWGREVGCKIRFQDHSSPDTVIKFMTDGILLAETQNDPSLREYEAILIDEAHERSLNIDFLLGFLRILHARRPELKIIITSATINTEAFSHAFNGAPVIEVSGRMFPVDIRYAPMDPDLEEGGDLTYIDAAVRETENVFYDSDRGDVLIFLPGERDIRETRDLLQGRFGQEIELVPLFGRLSNSDQQRAFAPSDRRKVILATNIAETSLTIPGICYVIDAGLARVSRYNPRTRTKRLPIEPVSQSSASQRAGRAGRIEHGVCVRLYSEEDFLQRPVYSTPEIQRSNLAEVILRLAASRLGEIESFPFLDPPTPSAISAGYDLLIELGALDASHTLTALGRDLARLPIDPTVGRMLLQSRTEHCVDEMLVIGAGLSIQDPRDRPADRQEAADQAHRRFVHPQSDFLTLLNIWNAFHDRLEALKTQNQVRKFCQAHFLSYLRMREWIDLHAQLQDALATLGELKPRREPAPPHAIHRSILTGLLGHVAQRHERNVYKASGNRMVTVFPGSTLFDRGQAPTKKRTVPPEPDSGSTAPKPTQPEWVAAGEIVETSRLYARTLAGVEAEWIADLGRHVCKTRHEDPHWDRHAGRVLIRERLFLHGLEVSNRRVAYANLNPDGATEIFIRQALVAEEIDGNYPFLEHNRMLREKIETWQTRLRRHDLASVDDALASFYGRHLRKVASVHELNRALRESGLAPSAFLCAQESDLSGGRDLNVDAQAFPEFVQVGSEKISIRYSYAPGEAHDGVTVTIPTGLARVLEPGLVYWLVPALREEQAMHLLRSLPKALRIPLMPLAPKASALAELLPQLPNLDALSRQVQSAYGVTIPTSAWDLASLPNHLRPKIELTNPDQSIAAKGVDLESMRAELQKKESAVQTGVAQDVWSAAVQAWEKPALSRWGFGTIPAVITLATIQGVPVHAYPALAPEDDLVSLKLFRRLDEAESTHRLGLRRLCELALSREMAWLQKDLRDLEVLKPDYVTLGPVEELPATAYPLLLRYLFDSEHERVLTESSYQTCVQRARDHLPGLALQLLDRLKPIFQARREILTAKRTYPGMIAELDLLIPKRFLDQADFETLRHYSRYLKAMQIRAERAWANPTKDQEKASHVKPFVDTWQQWRRQKSLTPAQLDRLTELRWAIEEFKVSVFAQELGTRFPVSARRLQDLIQQWISLPNKPVS